MGTYWRRQLADFETALRRMPGTTYRDWQPTKWQALRVLGDTIIEYAARAGHPICSATELGCGSATLLCQLSAGGIDCLGIDIDHDALELARVASASLAGSVGQIRFVERDFLDPSYAPGIADLTLSIGVIEHYPYEGQLRVLDRHIELSSRWVLIAIPNLASPLFQAFLRGMAADRTLYDEEHADVDVPALARDLGCSVVRSDGCHLFLSHHRDYRFADPQLRAFQRRLHSRLITINPRYRRFPDLDMTAADIDTLGLVEAGADHSERLRFGFLRWFLIDRRRPATNR